MDLNNIDKTTTGQKALAGGLIAFFLLLAYVVLPPVTQALHNIYIFAMYAIPLVIIVAFNKQIWLGFKLMSWNLTKGLVSIDKIGVMELQYQHLEGEVENIAKRKENVGTILERQNRKIKEKQKLIETFEANGRKYLERGEQTLAEVEGKKLIREENSLKNLIPMRDKLQGDYEHVGKLHETWSAGLLELRYNIDSLRDEYESAREMAEASGSIKEFGKGSSTEAKMYQEAVRQVEDDISRFTVQIDTVAKETAHITAKYDVEQEIAGEEGLARLKQKEETKLLN